VQNTAGSDMEPIVGCEMPREKQGTLRLGLRELSLVAQG
jgi:hypothetical protein